MPITTSVKSKANQELVAYCAAKIPAHVQDKIKLSITWHGSKATLIEHRPYFLDSSKWIDSPVAQLRFDSATGLWHLFCRDRNQRWHSFQPMPSSSNLHKLIAEIDRDQTGIFWG
ncbi:DUF3024 domain-containing protein [Geothrix sp. PMB-07]|uniref:DUF3024 domain-containing protein n=1 Tax=Geothrix sp. PMB-07 TaxID=3068640 RepID=UPI0027403DDA|nr:DUF3024 domain-containing protein [Geothrix sp. PMB-07]WLT30422.1 DUF3024 domain-containing protein [Geothrix sp. PMB-07]